MRAIIEMKVEGGEWEPMGVRAGADPRFPVGPSGADVSYRLIAAIRAAGPIQPGDEIRVREVRGNREERRER